jgi:hypothetical protein
LVKLKQNEASKRASGKNSPEMRRRNPEKPAAPKLNVDYTAEQLEVVTNIKR